MNIKVADLMVKSVVTTVPHKSMGHVKEIMKRNSISSVPVVDPDNQVVGIVTTSDLVSGVADSSPVSTVIKSKIYTIPMYTDIHVAARMMRNHNIHHLVVTHEKKIEGVISSFDLLKLVENHRFVMKNPPPESISPKK